MFGNTVLLIIALSLLVGLMGFCCVDYFLAATNQETFSEWTGHIYQYHIAHPQFFLMVGVISGFCVGLIMGFIMGHLFWPMPPEL